MHERNRIRSVVLLASLAIFASPGVSSAGFLIQPPFAAGARYSDNPTEPDPWFTLDDPFGFGLGVGFDGRGRGYLAETELKFNLPQYAPTLSVAELVIFVTGTQSSIGGSPPSFAISGVSAGGGLVTLDDFLLPRTYLGDSGPLSPSNAEQGTINVPISIDVLPYVRSLPPGGYADFVLSSSGGSSAVAKFGETFLITVAVPEPSAIAMTGLGLFGVFLCLWQRQRER